jgi:hypothetical protein
MPRGSLIVNTPNQAYGSEEPTFGLRLTEPPTQHQALGS